MMPSDLSIEVVCSFQKIYEEEFGESLSDGEARLMGVRVLRFFDIISRPLEGDHATPSR